jgi:hypothetical protein
VILIIAAQDTEAKILTALRDVFAIGRQDTRQLLFGWRASDLLKFKYNLRNAYLDVTRVVYVNTMVSPVELERVKAVADFAAQSGMPMVLVSPYSLLAADKNGDFMRAAATYIEGVVPQHFIIALAPLDGPRMSLVADEVGKLPESGWFGRYHIKTAGRGLGLEPVTRKDAPHSVRKRLDRSDLGG